MKQIAMYIKLLMLLMCAISCQAQVTAPGVPVTVASSDRSADPYFANEQTVDFYVPVITMEQLGNPQNNLQGYRIQIYRDGRAIYHGFREVRVLGERCFQIAPEQVQKIFEEFAKYKFWQVPEAQYGLPRGFGGEGWLFTLREGSKTKTIRADGRDYSLLLLKIIESEVKSSQWRCPYVDSRGMEKCETLEQGMNSSVERFMTRDLPKFLDTYK